LYESPTLSPDGSLVAYSSDENPEGYQELYVKQIAGGQPVRLTFDGFNNTTPHFSPDGSKIVFRSGRNGGGIYEIPAWGGSARLIARDGLAPRYSPDGSEVAYWKGAPSIGDSIPGNGEVWIAPVNGGSPRRVATQLSTARRPIWSPDGKRLLVVGYLAATSLRSAALDWWVVSTHASEGHGSAAVKTGAYDLLIRAGLAHGQETVTPVPSTPEPGCWSTAGNKVTFSRQSGDARNIWQLSISPETGSVEGGLERLTTGSGNELDPSCSGNAFVFASNERKANIWSFSLNSKSARALRPVAEEPAEQRNPSFSKDGRFLAFLSTRSGPGNVSLRELATGKEQIVAPSSLVQGFPIASSSGDRVAYASYEPHDRRAVYVSSPSEAPQKICEGCLRATDWSSGDKGLLVFGEDPYQIDYVDVASHHRTTLLKHPVYRLLYGRYSPDNRWISFTARTDSSHGRIFIAPSDGLKPIADHTWIPVAEVAPDDYASWSPDGSSMYFTSSRDGFTCLWGQRLEAVSHRPEGKAFAVEHFHGRLRMNHKGWSVSDTRIAITLEQKTGCIWMMSPAKSGDARSVQ
jgi:Tol biopolymer transport system component